MNNLVCFGEVLWDKFPNYKKIGGAPLNVALRLRSLGENVSFVSAVGNDEDGKLILDYLEKEELSSNYIQIHPALATGEVEVTLNAEGIASYSILSPRAWDEIVIAEPLKALVRNSEAFVFGSLVSRSELSKNTLFHLLKIAPYKVFDVNLRPPHYTLDLLKESLQAADFVKFNDEEIEKIYGEIFDSEASLETMMAEISEKFHAGTVCTTLGDKGAVLYHNKEFFKNPGYWVKVKDTVGAGDSFLATLLSGLLNQKDPQQALNYACAMGAFVASQEGANPKTEESEIIELFGLKAPE